MFTMPGGKQGSLLIAFLLRKARLIQEMWGSSQMFCEKESRFYKYI